MEKTLKNSFFRRIKYLMLLQMGDMIRAHKNSDKKKKYFIIFLKTVLSIVVTAALVFVFYYFKNSVHVKLSMQLFTSLLLISQIISIISCTTNLISVLYTGKDNTMLLAFPCSYDEIFVSKIAVFALEELKKSVFFLLPYLIAYGIMGGGVWYWVLLIPSWLLVCLLPVAVGALVSIPLIYVKRFLAKHVVLGASLLIISLAVAFYFVTIILDKLPDPLRLVAIYNEFISKIEATLVQISSWSFWYIFLGKAMFGEAVYLYFPLFLITFVAIVLVAFILARPVYFKAVSSTNEAGRTKKHKHFKHKHNSLFLTFFRKELKLFFRNSQSVTSAVFTIFLFPLISYIFNFILVAINQNVLGEFMSIAFNVMITLSILSANNANSAASISREGSEFAVLKTAPTDTSIICYAKIAVIELINVVSILSTIIVLSYTTEISFVNLIMLVVLLILLTTSHILWSFQLDITNPQILQYATKGNEVINNPNVAKAVVIGFIISTLAGLLVLLLLMENFISGWIRVILIALALTVFRAWLFKTNVKVYFNDVQM